MIQISALNILLIKEKSCRWSTEYFVLLLDFAICFQAKKETNDRQRKRHSRTC